MEDKNQKPSLKSLFIPVGTALLVIALALAALLWLNSRGGKYVADAYVGLANSWIDLYGGYYDKESKLVSEDGTYSSESHIAVEPREDFLSELGHKIGEDDAFNWIDQFEINAKNSLGPDQICQEYALAINESDTLSAQILYDLSTGQTYLQVPELSDDYISSATGLGLKDLFAMYAGVLSPSDQMVDPEIYRKFSEKYIREALKELEFSRPSSKDISAQGILEKTTQVRARVTNLQLEETKVRLLTQLKSDMEFARVLQDLANAWATIDGEFEIGELSYVPGDDYEDFYLDVMDLIDEEITQAQAEVDRLNKDKSEVKLVMTFDTFLHKKDKSLAGFAIYDERNSISVDPMIYAEFPRDEENFAVNIFSKMPDYIFSLTGTGSDLDENITADLTLDLEENAQVKLDIIALDRAALYQGRTKGEFNIDMTGHIYNDIMNVADLDQYEYQIQCDMEPGQGQARVLVAEDGTEMMKVDITTAPGTYSKKDLPAESDLINLDSPNGFSQYIGELKLENLAENLRKAGLPKYYYNLIRLMGF
ncbi:MAG: hypothetical protein K5773_02370 [Pseudobutyrivibrio sp.]|nr:hypothetical protein [Pseudobutyrivibrio sp.]